MPLTLALESMHIDIQASYALGLTVDAALVAQRNLASTCWSTLSLVTREHFEHAWI
jgi:hypothetical protein